MANKVETFLWLTRIFTVIFTIMFMLPVFGYALHFVLQYIIYISRNREVQLSNMKSKLIYVNNDLDDLHNAPSCNI